MEFHVLYTVLKPAIRIDFKIIHIFLKGEEKLRNEEFALELSRPTPKWLSLLHLPEVACDCRWGEDR